MVAKSLFVVNLPLRKSMRGQVSTYLRFLKAVALTLLLAAYLMGAMKLNGFHELLHADDHKITHLQSDEADGCHRAIYHNDKDGCEHKNHISTNHHCQLCDLILTTDQEAESNLPEKDSQHITVHKSFCQYSTETIPAAIRQSRAPPIC
jgi:hypothetical protein